MWNPAIHLMFGIVFWNSLRINYNDSRQYKGIKNYGTWISNGKIAAYFLDKWMASAGKIGTYFHQKHKNLAFISAKCWAGL